MSATSHRLEPLPGRHRAGLLIVLILGSLTALGPVTIDLYLPALPQVGRSLAARPVSVQLTVTAFLIGVAVGQLIVGPLSDTLGRRRPLLAGLGAYVLISAACVEDEFDKSPEPLGMITWFLFHINNPFV